MTSMKVDLESIGRACEARTMASDTTNTDEVILRNLGILFEDEVVLLARFWGSIEHAFTCAILFRNDLNHKGYAYSSLDGGGHVTLPYGSKAEVRPYESDGGGKQGYRVVYVPKY